MATALPPDSELVREQAVAALDRLPAFSPILNRLLATVAADEVSFAELGFLIENDTVLAGSVLRLVNSPLYGLQGAVNSVRHAVAILGVNKIRNVALSLSISRMWGRARTPEAWSGARFNLHSAATAIMADLIAQRARAPYPEGAFVAGLLHDTGKLLIAVSFPSEFAAIRTICGETGRGELESEEEVLGVTHAELSSLALVRWALPPPIQSAVGRHHAPEQADEGRLHLAFLVQAADRLANELGHSIMERPECAKAAENPFDALGLRDYSQRILDDFQVEFESVRALF